MTIRDLLNRINKEKPHSFTEADVISWVNEIETEVAEQMRLTEIPVYVYEHDTELDKVLLAPAPYDQLYVSYVKAKIDYANEEYDSYTNNQAQHVQDFNDFSEWVVRAGKADADSTVYPHRFRNVFR